MTMSAVTFRRLAAGGASPRRRQRGSIAIMFIAALLVIFGFFGLALDLSQLYNRKMEMQATADTVALAAAIELNGTSGGITRALTKAGERFFTLPGTTTGGVSYQYATRTMEWTDEAIRFGPTPDGPWRSAGDAFGQPAGLFYAKVDTAGLDAEYGLVNTLFIDVVAPDQRSASTSARAVAGRFAIKAVPFGICAMRPEPGRSHGGDLEEFGFRRGVVYDLMQLNPNATGSGQTFLLNPVVAPGAAGAAPAPDVQLAAPFICTGTMAMARVTGGELVVKSPFPLGELYSYFNSRFDVHVAPCNTMTAPPDINIKEYKLNATDLPWMKTLPASLSAAPSTEDGKLWTIVGPDTRPLDATAASYGPLWSYAKAAKASAYTPGSPEPSGGYATYGTGDWNTLYNPGKPEAKSYPSSGTPYTATTTSNYVEPANKGVKDRRVLNVPLLSCPVSGDRALVLGIGKFFMTVKADPASIRGEFAGVASESALGTNIKLFP